MAAPQRREFLGLALGGALAAAGAPASVRPAAAEPLASPVPFTADTVLKAAAQLAAAPFKAPSAPLPSVFSGLNFEQYASIRRVAGDCDLGRPEARLFPRAAASRLRLHDADHDQHRRERPFAAGHLRPGRLRFRQAAAAGRDGRSRLFRPAHPQGVGRGLSGRRDLPGRKLLPLARAGPEFRRHGARPGDPHRRRAGRGVSAVSRVLGREADARRRTR